MTTQALQHRTPRTPLRVQRPLDDVELGVRIPSATNFNMSMSRAWLATMLYKRAFSFSSSLRRLASLAFMPPY